MPNDCYNIIDSISHTNPEKMMELKQALQQDPPCFFEKFLPCLEGIERKAYWGTKWDVYDVEYLEPTSEEYMSFSFYTAWSPPCLAYEKLRDMGFVIEAKFMESGFDFCGYWQDGIQMTYECVSDKRDSIPEEFHFYFFNVEEEDEEEEEEEEDP